MLGFVFHFNRGAFLENAMRSVGRHASFPFIIFDDDSTDPESLAALERLSKTFEVIQPTGPIARQAHTGGLQSNMWQAMAIARSRGEDIVLFLQDDTQLVRDVTPKDLQIVRTGFQRPNAACVISSNFLKKSEKGGLDHLLIKDVGKKIFERHATNTMELGFRHGSFSDVGFFNTKLYFEQIPKPYASEAQAEVALRAKGFFMGQLYQPMSHWLPLPVTYRDRNRTWIVKALDAIGGVGLHPIESLSEAQLQTLNSCCKEAPPYEMDFLSAPTVGRLRYWPVTGGKHALRARYGLRRMLYHLLY
ncbi:MAG: glycosyltransferase family A protein [Pseudomonadota bacterium]